MHIDVLFFRSICSTRCGCIVILQQSAVRLFGMCSPFLPSYSYTLAMLIGIKHPTPKRHPMQRAENPNHPSGPSPRAFTTSYSSSAPLSSQPSTTQVSHCPEATTQHTYSTQQS
jgi:hypothetical protein